MKRIVFFIACLQWCCLTGFSQAPSATPAQKTIRNQLEARSLTMAPDLMADQDPAGAGFSKERLARIDELLKGYLSDDEIAGVSALIARNGKVVYQKAFGYSQDAIFRIASQSKAVTSVAVMMLMEEGKFLLDDPVSRYIPEFSQVRVMKKLDRKSTRLNSSH